MYRFKGCDGAVSVRDRLLAAAREIKSTRVLILEVRGNAHSHVSLREILIDAATQSFSKPPIVYRVIHGDGMLGEYGACGVIGVADRLSFGVGQ